MVGAGARLGGPPPDLYNLPRGCHVRNRCAFAAEGCTATPPEVEVGAGHVVRCHFAGKLPDTQPQDAA